MALEHASDERDALLTEAAAASELRRRLAQATAERDALSEKNAQLQQEAQQLSAAGDLYSPRRGNSLCAGSTAQHQQSRANTCGVMVHFTSNLMLKWSCIVHGSNHNMLALQWLRPRRWLAPR